MHNSKSLIIFDCDGTLVDSEIIASQVFPKVWTEMGVNITPDFFLCNFVGTGADAEIVVQTKAKLPPGGMDIADQRFLDELYPSVQAVDGIHSLLKELEGINTCVASNSSLNYIDRVLKATKLSSFFADRIYSAHQVKKAKPAPDLFLHAARELRAEPKDCLVIEDSAFGIEAAKRAGMQVVGFFGGKHCNSAVKNRVLSAGADFYAENTNELRRLLISS